MIKKLVFFLIMGFTATLNATGTTNCECGEHSTGITTYTVNGDKCCSSPIAAGTVGYEYGYVMNEGAWSLSSTTEITGSEAQRNCCNLP